MEHQHRAAPLLFSIFFLMIFNPSQTHGYRMLPSPTTTPAVTRAPLLPLPPPPPAPAAQNSPSPQPAPQKLQPIEKEPLPFQTPSPSPAVMEEEGLIPGFVFSDKRAHFQYPKNTDPGLLDICSSTDYPSICISTLGPMLEGYRDPLSVLEIAINAASEEAKLALSVAETVATSPSTTAETAFIANDCEKQYKIALDKFQVALDSIPGHETEKMFTMLEAAIKASAICNNELAGLNSECPLLDFSSKVEKMATNSFGISSLIK